MSKENVYTGQLNTRIQIIERQRSTSATGDKDYTDVVFNTLWAKVDDLSGNEQEDGKIIALNVRKYTVKFFPALAVKKITDLYISQNGQEYNIHSVANIGHQAYMQLKCSKRE